MSYMDAYISEENWYPRRLRPYKVKRKIMREAFLEGYNAKQIAAYFRMSLTSVYQSISVRALKAKILAKELKQKEENL